MELISSDLFYFKTGMVYPPFKNGMYLEEYFLEFMQTNKLKYDKTGRLYIPAFWTNFQIEGWFENNQEVRNNMQNILNQYIIEHSNEKGYFTIVQHDDGSFLKLPENTIVYGSCNGDIPLPLIYEDNNKTLENIHKKSFHEKEILSSFVGTNTHHLRSIMMEKLSNNKSFMINKRQYWSADVTKNDQDNFIYTTINSKFGLAPRGYGRSSFRFFEMFKLGTIPIYIWDDVEWLPYKEIIDYSKICISIHVSQIDNLEHILLDIDEEKYKQMWDEYEKVKHMFELEYMCEYVTGFTKKTEILISLCIPTMNRFTNFLNRYLDIYLEYLKEGVIDEIVISDENGVDYEAILNKYGDYIRENDNFRVYKNESNLGVFANKLKVCSYSRNELIALIDSDNFAPRDYFLNIKKYIVDKMNGKIPKNLSLSPSFARPRFSYKEFAGHIIVRENIKSSFEKNCFHILLNTGNYVITKNIIDNIKFDKDLLFKISAYDVIYFNLLVFQQFDDFTFHVIEDVEYDHVVHDDSIHLKTFNNCVDFYHSYILPTIKNL